MTKDKELNFLEDLLGPLAAWEETALRQARKQLLVQRLLFSKETWTKINNSRTAINHKLVEDRPHINPATVRVGEQPLWEFVNQINKALHSTERTQGAVHLRDQVASSQGGEYCAMCGSLDKLQVDHIRPVSHDGERNALPNLQLLCEECNSGKRAIQNNDSRYIFEATDAQSNRLRYLVLRDQAHQADGRFFGQCSKCASLSKDVALKVTKLKPNLAFSYSNLRTVCI